MARTYDPNLDNVFVKMDGRILWDGEEIGLVTKLGEADAKLVGGRWRAEVGDATRPEVWPGYRAVYSRTKRDAVAQVLESVEAPDG